MRLKWIYLFLILVSFAGNSYAEDPCKDATKIWSGWWQDGTNKYHATAIVKTSDNHLIINVTLDNTKRYDLLGTCTNGKVKITGLSLIQDPHPFVNLEGQIIDKTMLLSGDITKKHLDGEWETSKLDVKFLKGPFENHDFTTSSNGG